MQLENVATMKKIILFLLLSLALVLTACGKGSDGNNDTSKRNDIKDIVQIENNYNTRGEKKIKVMPKKLKKLLMCRKIQNVQLPLIMVPLMN